MIRQLTETDLPEMAELFLSVFNGEPWNEEWDLENARERITIVFKSVNSICSGYFENGKLLGFIQGYHRPYQTKRVFCLEEMCVSSTVQRMGIGTKLWDFLEQKLIERGVGSIHLNTLRGSSAEQFYTKQGCMISESIPLMYKKL